MYAYESELYHHGIKGMKWGVRRYQNDDGTLTGAGKKRYADDNGETGEGKQNLIQKHKSRLVQKYIEKGYSQHAAEVAAKSRMKTELIVGSVATVAVAVIAKKAATRIGQDYCDKIIKSGKSIQNINANGKTDFNDTPFFAAINRHDKKAYGSLYPNEKRGFAKNTPGQMYDGIYNNKIKITKDVKRASVNNARKIFYDKMNADPNFKKDVIETIKSTAYGNDADKLLKTNPKLFYDRFNQALATPQFQSKGIHKQFYSALEKQGYNAILDINDTRYSGYKAISKSPTIFFGKDKWEKVGSTKLSEAEIDSNAMKYSIGMIGKNFGKTTVRNASIIVAAKSVSDRKAIEKYLDEHPNSKLSDKEILKITKSNKYR